MLLHFAGVGPGLPQRVARSLDIHGNTILERIELEVLEALDTAVLFEATRHRIDEIVDRVDRKLERRPDEVLAWEPIPLEFYVSSLPEGICSSWVFILRAHTVTGAERHPNSHQRMMSYRGSGDFQTLENGHWRSHFLNSEPTAPLEDRWISIPPNIWHQGVVLEEQWVVVSFHTVPADELIEERPESENSNTTRRRKYIGDR